MGTCAGCGKVIPEGTQVCPICVDRAVRAAGNKIREHLCEEPIQKKKVKIFSNKNEHLLAEAINHFIEDKKVHDIQYQMAFRQSSYDGDFYSAMIIYEEVN
jgi:predicted amidophosphoribosyltransferase